MDCALVRPLAGGGFELALLCDWIYAGQSSKFCFPEVARGLFPGLGGGTLLGKQVGLSYAKELVRQHLDRATE